MEISIGEASPTERVPVGFVVRQLVWYESLREWHGELRDSCFQEFPDHVFIAISHKLETSSKAMRIKLLIFVAGII